MALTQQTRPETLILAWRRDSPTSPIRIAAGLTQAVEFYDDATGTYAWGGEIPAQTINTADVAALVGSNLGPLTDQVAALQAQLDQAHADTENATSAAEQAKAQAASLQEQLTAANAQIAKLTEQPAVPTVMNYQFKMALAAQPSLSGAAGKTLLDDVTAFMANAPAVDQVRWTLAPQFMRNDQMMNDLAAQLDPTPGDAQALLDKLFAAAATMV